MYAQMYFKKYIYTLMHLLHQVLIPMIGDYEKDRQLLTMENIFPIISSWKDYIMADITIKL